MSVIAGTSGWQYLDWRGAFYPPGSRSRYLTHVRRLRDPAEPVQRLMAAAGGLGDRLGPVLVGPGRAALSPLWRTADWGYLRLHEGDGDPWPRYRPATLSAWAGPITAAWAASADVYAYFNNDQHCAAPRDAAAFAAAVAGRGRARARAWSGPDG